MDSRVPTICLRIATLVLAVHCVPLIYSEDRISAGRADLAAELLPSASLSQGEDAGRAEATHGSVQTDATADGSDKETLKILQDDAAIARYCHDIAANLDHANGLTQVCEFALSRRKELPDILCEREMKRSWMEFWMGLGASVEERKFSDVITATVRYKDGEELYDAIRINGKPVSPTAPQVSGTWSGGEFAAILEDLFRPSSKTTFIFDKEATLETRKVLIFNYHVKSQDNKAFVLHVDQKFWFPEYSGRLWLDRENFQLLRLERKTAYMHDDPIRRMETDIEYSDLSLGDNTREVLPVRSKVLICMPPPMLSLGDVCAHHSIVFTDWRKFGVTTRILPDTPK